MLYSRIPCRKFEVKWLPKPRFSSPPPAPLECSFPCSRVLVSLAQWRCLQPTTTVLAPHHFLGPTSLGKTFFLVDFLTKKTLDVLCSSSSRCNLFGDLGTWNPTSLDKWCISIALIVVIPMFSLKVLHLTHSFSMFFEVEFPVDVDSFFSWFSILLLDLDSFGFACLAGSDTALRYMVSVIFFPIGVLWLLLNYGVPWAAKGCLMVCVPKSGVPEVANWAKIESIFYQANQPSLTSNSYYSYYISVTSDLQLHWQFRYWPVLRLIQFVASHPTFNFCQLSQPTN